MSSKSRSSRTEEYSYAFLCLLGLWFTTTIIQAILSVYYVKNPENHQRVSSSPTYNGSSVVRPELESILASIQAIHDTISAVNQTLHQEIATEINKLTGDDQRTRAYSSYQPYRNPTPEDDVDGLVIFFHVLLALPTVAGWIASLVGTMALVEIISESFASWIYGTLVIGMASGLAVVAFGVGAAARWFDYVNCIIFSIVVVVTLNVLIGGLMHALGYWWYAGYQAPPETRDCDVEAGEGDVKSLEKESGREN